MTSQKVANNPLGSYPVLADRNSSYELRQAVGIDIGSVSGGVLTESRVSSTNPLPIAISPSPTSALTGSAPGSATIGATDAQIVPANASRRGLIICNNSANRVHLGLGNTAVSGKGIYLAANSGVWVMDAYTFTLQEIRGIASGAGSLISFQELI